MARPLDVIRLGLRIGILSGRRKELASNWRATGELGGAKRHCLGGELVAWQAELGVELWVEFSIELFGHHNWTAQHCLARNNWPAQLAESCNLIALNWPPCVALRLARKCGPVGLAAARLHCALLLACRAFAASQRPASESLAASGGPKEARRRRLADAQSIGAAAEAARPVQRHKMPAALRARRCLELAAFSSSPRRADWGAANRKLAKQLARVEGAHWAGL